VAGGWRRLHDEELHKAYSSLKIIRMIKSMRMRWGHVARMGNMRSAYRVLVGESEGKRPIGRQRRSWEVNSNRDGGRLRTGFIWLWIGTGGEPM
jgi:hypothetical protein